MRTFRITQVLAVLAAAAPLVLTQSPPSVATPPIVTPDGPSGQAARTGERVELPQLRTASRQVFVNPDGTHTLVQHATPAIDSTLTVGIDGRVHPASDAKGLTFSDGGTGDGLVSLGSLRMGWPGVLPKPTLRGDTATYAEVLPGVDLRLRAEPTGFSKALIVKNRAAASNPALRELRFKVSGLTFTARPDGTTLAADRRGHVVLAAPQALMWDSGSEPITVKAGSTLQGGVLTVRPDQAMLTSAATRYPVTIDPSWSDPADDLWTHVDLVHPDQDYWAYDRDQGAKVGQAWGPDTDTYRSVFQLATTGIAGARVIDARFTIVLDHSPTGSPTPTDLYRTTPISRANPVTWNNTGWPQYLATASGNAWTGHQPDMSMGFASPALTALLQGVADRRESSISLGLRAPNEGDETQWKRFHGETATIVVTYNNPPRAPLKVNFDSPRSCGTATAPTAVNDPTPTFSAVGSDPDGDNLVNRLELHRVADDSTVYQQDTAITGNGAAFSWAPVPDGTLTEGTPYYYVARSNDQVAGDGIEFGAASPRCYFVLDATSPGVPALSSTDFPDGLPGRPAREVGIVKLSPAAGDTDVTEYRYGFTQDRILLTVKAKPDGTADLPVSVPATSRKLFVRAVDRAGNPSLDQNGQPAYASWTMLAKSNGTAPRIRGDVNGDGAADVVMVLDQGNGRTGIWNVDSLSGAFATGTLSWDSGINGGFALSRSLPVQGDFNNDGRSDVAFFRDEPGRRPALYPMYSDGNRYDPPPTPVWKAAAADWTIASARVTSGDVNGDKISDIVVQLNTGNGTWRVLVFPGGNLAAPVQWLQTTAAGGEWALTQPVVADVDGDGKDDFAVVRKISGCRTAIDVYPSSGTAFGAAKSAYDGDYCADKGHPVVGDVDGDGKDDIVAIYDTGSGTSLKVFRSTGTAYTVSDWWTGAGWDPLRTSLQVGDFNKDGKDDAALVAALDGGGRQVSRLPSSGTGFGTPVQDWSEAAVGAGTGPKYDIEPRTYELVSRNSGKCMEVAGASQTDPAVVQQWDCFGGLHQRFRVVPVAGTEQYQLEMVHVNGASLDGSPRCVDVGNQSTADDAPLVQWKCVGTGNQQVLLDYVEGSSYDTVVRLRFAHSGKCAAVQNAGTGNGNAVIQRTCAAVPEQQWILRAALNSTQLDGRYKVGVVLQPNDKDYVLDIKDCTPASGVRTWDWIPASSCQRWQFKPLGDDIYQIVDPSTNTALQLLGCSRQAAAQVIVLQADQSECQRWRVEPAIDGTWTIQQADTGFTLDVPRCVDTKADQLIVWHYWNGPCQRWRLTKM
ncbi:RICIN domain-containing protein [Kribbella sp. NPDC059898]|uniref:RICIN domain-containing protein n=1 Tax=Kribbella sp. NPDC059898 TaxID=3346995 RepID=UPI00365E8659